MFNFSLNEVKQPSASKFLKPYTINKDVTLNGVEIKKALRLQVIIGNHLILDSHAQMVIIIIASFI